MRVWCVVALLVLLAGCAADPAAQTRNYDEAVAELGAPLSCDVKDDGSRFCMWPDPHGIPLAQVRRYTIMEFDVQGHLLKRYFQNSLYRSGRGEGGGGH